MSADEVPHQSAQHPEMAPVPGGIGQRLPPRARHHGVKRSGKARLDRRDHEAGLDRDPAAGEVMARFGDFIP